MAQNKVQYQRGLSMQEFFDGYGTPEQCEALVRSWRWPDGFVCPRCRGGWHSEFRRRERLYFQCSACRHQCSLVSGTVFESSKLPLPKWFLAMHLPAPWQWPIATVMVLIGLGLYVMAIRAPRAAGPKGQGKESIPATLNV